MRAAAFLLLLLVPSCGGTDAPEVTVLEAMPAMLVTSDDAADDVTIVVQYKDGDGDLGEGIAEIADCRSADIVVLIDLPAIASEEGVAEGVSIEGELELFVANVGLVEPDATAPPVCAALGVTTAPSAGEVVFCVTLIDAAGHRGTGDCTGAIAIE